MKDNDRKLLQDFFKRDDVIEAVNSQNWTKVFELFDFEYTSIYIFQLLVDFLLEANIDFIPYMTKVCSYNFFESTLLKEADLKECIYIGSRAFRKSSIAKIHLYKDKIKELGVAMLSEVDHPVSIIWNGTYDEWLNLRRNSNCWNNYPSSVSIHCIDGVFAEDKSFS